MPDVQDPGVFSAAEHVEILNSLSAPARALWAKSGDERGWLALPQHMLDTCGVSRYLWDCWAPRSVRAAVSEALGLPDEDARTVLAFLASAHDVGKAIRCFQRQASEELLDRVRDAGMGVELSPIEMVNTVQHATASGVIVKRWLKVQGVPTRSAVQLANIADAHHGSPSQPTDREKAADVIDAHGRAWADLHTELMDYAAEISGIRSVLPSLASAPRLKAPGQTLLTALVVMSDWIASNQDVFVMTPDGLAGERSAAVAGIDLTPPWRAEAPDVTPVELLADRFGWDGAQARPVQVAALDAARELGSGLLIVEAPTGEGKTEAALGAAEILAAASGAGGVMVAAPTMSTADGLLLRVIDWARRAADGQIQSAFLAHSKSDLNDDYRQIGSGDDTVVASQWMSGRKKGVLSNVVVGTVDQVLTMSLQARHSMLRHLALAGKVVVIDEVHAYDAYMSEYLATTLSWLARYRVPVVLLSATLPVSQKRHLVNAYRGTEDDLELSTAYPLVTAVGAGQVREIAVQQRPADLSARIEIVSDRIDDLVGLLPMDDGGCVLVICNTVGRAQSAYRRLTARFPGIVELHHAAFVSSERIRKEAVLRDALGPAAHRGAGRPHRRIIVATQVAEQSLDIDVDLLITDIAPMDLLIQRIGRLHRHARPAADRPASMRTPRVLVRGVLDRDAPTFDRGIEYVYERELLIATLAVLRERGDTPFVRPDDISTDVQRTYDSPPVPDEWREAYEDARATAERERGSSKKRSETYRIPEPKWATNLDALFAQQLAGAQSAADADEKGLAQVRDSSPSIEVVLLEEGDGHYRRVNGEDVAIDDQVLATDTVRLPTRITRPEDLDAVIAHLEAATPPSWNRSRWLRGRFALPLRHGTAQIGDHTLTYDQKLGLTATTARD